MNILTLVFVSLTIFLHALFFVAESVLWLDPGLYEPIVLKLDAPGNTEPYQQARILEVLFFNQGFYNLFIACGGIAGIILFKVGKTQAGIALVTYICLFALGAGVVLAFSTRAYTGALIQGLPPLVALLGLYFSAKRESLGTNKTRE